LIPAVYGDVMRVERYKIEDGYVVVMRREDGKVYSVVEFL
jgi:hypothetical protein